MRAPRRRRRPSTGALPGLAQAQSLTPLQRLQRLQQSGLAECGGAGEPIYLAWRQFLRGHGPSVLVIDATGLDVRARGTAAVLDSAPWLLAEGVLIAAGLRDSLKVELRLPAELTGREAALLNAVDAIRSLAQVAAPRMQVEVLRNSRPSCWGEGRPPTGRGSIHTPETWCRIALLFAGVVGPRRVAADAPARPRSSAAWSSSRASGNLRHQIDEWGGGVEVARPRMPCSSSTTAWAASCRSPRRTCRASRCRSRRRASSRRRPP
ncbi:MAG: hypothetical protein MZV65_18420 [Chromatiales bacterium]|nr:hypothetical protein [Chromatiales bacterium]